MQGDINKIDGSYKKSFGCSHSHADASASRTRVLGLPWASLHGQA